MAKFAEIDENNVIIQIIVVAEEDCLDENENHSEAVGEAFCQNLFNSSNLWKQTSYPNNINKSGAGVGYFYDAELDVFIPPQPYPSWTLNSKIYQWECPVPYPADSPYYIWDEDAFSWVLPDIEKA